MFVYTCVCEYRCTCVHAHVEATGLCKVSSSTALCLLLFILQRGSLIESLAEWLDCFAKIHNPSVSTLPPIPLH